MFFFFAEPREDGPIFHDQGGGSVHGLVRCFCLVPHIPSLTDRSREPLVLLPIKGSPPLATQCLSTDGFWW